jgi:hypothetical protein
MGYEAVWFFVDYPDDGDSNILRNVGTYIPVYIVNISQRT